jgi:hypothetical protein
MAQSRPARFGTKTKMGKAQEMHLPSGINSKPSFPSSNKTGLFKHVSIKKTRIFSRKRPKV